MNGAERRWRITSAKHSNSRARQRNNRNDGPIGGSVSALGFRSARGMQNARHGTRTPSVTHPHGHATVNRCGFGASPTARQSALLRRRPVSLHRSRGVPTIAGGRQKGGKQRSPAATAGCTRITSVVVVTQRRRSRAVPTDASVARSLLFLTTAAS